MSLYESGDSSGEVSLKDLFDRVTTKFACGVDEVALLPIYPAREEPIEGVTSEWLMEKIGTKRALVLPNILAKYLRERVKQCMAQGKDCVVVTMGAGDISDQVNDIEKALQI